MSVLIPNDKNIYIFQVTHHYALQVVAVYCIVGILCSNKIVNVHSYDLVDLL